MEKNTRNLITKVSKDLAHEIEKKRDLLTNILLDYESLETVEDEIFRSKDCLENIDREVDYLLRGQIGSMCTFFPVNLPLYSLVLFALIPSFMAKNVFVRPPELMSEVVRNLMEVLNLKSIFPNVYIVEMERGLFRDAYVAVADVVLFTGKYENAMSVQVASPKAIFIYNGAGVNPIVITETANLELASQKTVEMRVFNSGQDCAGSDAILVHEKVKDVFLQKVLEDIKVIKVGDYHNRKNRVGRIVKQDHLPELAHFFSEQKKHMVFGGKIDFDLGIVYPTVFLEKMKEISSIHFTEFFAPVFYVLVYENDEDLKKYFFDKYYQEHAMYISLFGESPFVKSMKNSVILENRIVNDVERGNYPYGGYGDKANFVVFEGKRHVRPILISKEIANFLPREDR